MTRLSPSFTPQPYSSDIERLEDEFAWVRARARHFSARIEAEQEAEQNLPAACPVEAGDSPEDKVNRLAVLEQNLRDRIDGRLAATAEAGRVLGLEQLVSEYQLDEVEQMALLLSFIPTTGLDFYRTLGDLGSYGFAIMSVSPEMVAVFCDLDLEDRIKMIEGIGPEGTLARAGLVRIGWDVEDDLNDFWTAGISLLPKAQRVLVGGVSADDSSMRCPHCARPRRAVAEA